VARAQVLHWMATHSLDAAHNWTPPVAERGRQWRIHKQTKGRLNNISLVKFIQRFPSSMNTKLITMYSKIIITNLSGRNL